MQKIGLSFTLFCLLAAAAPAQKKTSSIRIQGDTLIGLWGRTVLLSQQGFPQQLTSYFAANGKDTTDQATPLLVENIHFHFTGAADGKDIRLKSGGISFTQRSAEKASWTGTSVADGLSMLVEGMINARGEMKYAVTVTALQDLDLKDIVMHIPFEKGVAKRMIGWGKNGDYQPDSIYHWKFVFADGHPVDRAWIGSDNAGLGYRLDDLKQWMNEGKGGVDIGIKGKSMLAHNYTGIHHLVKGDVLHYNFELVVTPPTVTY